MENIKNNLSMKISSVFTRTDLQIYLNLENIYGNTHTKLIYSKR